MKKLFVLGAAVMVGIFSASAQQEALARTNFGSNWSVGVEGGVATPMSHHAFFGSMRGVVGVNVHKQISPTFGLGVEGQFGINTSSWSPVKSSTAFDASYVGLYGTANLFNLFGGYQCGGRVFDIDLVAGAGWGHDYYNKGAGTDDNYFATRTGLNFNFNVSQNLTIAVKPAVVWAMTSHGYNFDGIKQTSAGYNRNNAAFEVMVGLKYRFGDGFQCVEPYNQAEIDALNARINELRGDVDASVAALAASQAEAAALAAQLQACQSRPTTVVKETTNTLSSVRYVFFKIGSSKITADQMPNVEMVAAYLKNHPNSKVVVKGYASPDGNYDFNVKLAAARAESVKNSLIKKYGIKADRITAEGEGIGNMFAEESWNRVSICTIED
ncbi:MAG: OmpA family protein [Clostridium sp.]|nr:OmpA family protein [Clostridium sp.]